MGGFHKRCPQGFATRQRNASQMALDLAPLPAVSLRSLPSGNMKPIAHLLAVLSLAVVFTGCETTRKDSCCGSARGVDSRDRRDRLTATEKVGYSLFWLAQTALYGAATGTVQLETAFPR